MALLFVLISITALILILLIIPLGVHLSASFHGGAVFRARISCFFGLFSWELSTGPSGKDKKTKQAADGRSSSGISRVIEAAQVKGLGDRIRLLAKHLARGTKLHYVRSDLMVSLGDDYYTGMLAGLLIPLVLYLNQSFDDAIKFRPAFEEDLFLEGDISGDLQVRPIHVLAPCLDFALSPEFRRARQIMVGEPCK